MNFFQRAKIRYILHRYQIPHDLWHGVVAELRLLHRLSAVEKAHLRELSTLFLHQKNLIGVELTVTKRMRMMIAAQACLPVLHLGLNLLEIGRILSSTLRLFMFAVMKRIVVVLCIIRSGC